MRLIEQTEKYVVDSEEDAIKVIQNFKKMLNQKDIYQVKAVMIIRLKKPKEKLLVKLGL